MTTPDYLDASKYCPRCFNPVANDFYKSNPVDVDYYEELFFCDYCNSLITIQKKYREYPLFYSENQIEVFPK